MKYFYSKVRNDRSLKCDAHQFSNLGEAISVLSVQGEVEALSEMQYQDFIKYNFSRAITQLCVEKFNKSRGNDFYQQKIDDLQIEIEELSAIQNTFYRGDHPAPAPQKRMTLEEKKQFSKDAWRNVGV